MSFDFDQFIQTQDDLIKKGMANQVRDNLKNLPKIKIPRNKKPRLANLARRSGEADMSLGLLYKIVRTENQEATQPTHEELYEYATSLIHVGAVSEALELLESIDAMEMPQVHYARGAAHFSLWQYNEAIPHFENFIASENVSPYMVLVGKLNLAAAYMTIKDYSLSTQFAQEVRQQAQKEEHHLICGNSLEVLAQNNIALKNYNQAEKSIDAARSFIKDNKTLSSLWLRKWQAVVQVFKGEVKAGVSELNKIESMAKEMMVFETVRECRLFRSIALKDEQEFLKVYFSTPFESYRQRALESYRENCGSTSIPESFVHHWSGDSCSILDSLRAESDDQSISLSPLDAHHRLLLCLCRDLVRPARVADVHAFLNPGEYYNYLSTPHKIHETVFRTRGYLEENDIGLDIVNSSAGYLLQGDGKTALRQYLSYGKAEAKEAVWLERIFSRLPGQTYTNKDLCENLGLSRNYVSDLLKYGIAKGALIREQQGRSFIYRQK